MGRNKLAPADRGVWKGIANFLLSFSIAVVWLCRSIMKLTVRLFTMKGKQE
ncbi:hypothetical protein [uncultured Anaerovibrio sp.]|uniref:hypothetical protein n=1 Tax=uncultured Anaerovibrio sp. TaxID=361586 RepID=UPI0026374707|nr:hypothetical protein [uncultured Anaerovibrio sp.]